MSQVLPGVIPSPVQSNTFEYDSHAKVPTSIPAYPGMQANRPMAVQPTTRGEGMVYPDLSSNQGYVSQLQQYSPANNHLISSQSYGPSPLGIPGQPIFASTAYQGRYPQAAERVDGIGQPRGLDVVLTNQKPTQAKRGPFKTNDEREATAETRKIGSCIRCRMQRIRVSTYHLHY